MTRINLVDLVTGLPNMRHIVLGLVQPDVIERVQTTITTSVPLSIGCTDPAPSSRTTGGTTLTATPGCVQPSEAVTVAGTGFPVGREAQLFLVDANGFSRRGPAPIVAPDGSLGAAF